MILFSCMPASTCVLFRCRSVAIAPAQSVRTVASSDIRSTGLINKFSAPVQTKHGFAFIRPGLAGAAVIEKQHLAPLTLYLWFIISTR